MKFKNTLGILTLLLALGCSQGKGPTSPDDEFEWFLTGSVALKDNGKAASNVFVRVTDNNTNQSETGTTNSDGAWKETRWLTEPTSLKAVWSGVPPQQIKSGASDSIQFTCVQHPQNHAARLCRFQIVVEFDSGFVAGGK